MENQIENTLTNEIDGQGKRPQFLSVLCILSFICIGLMLLMSLYGLVANTPERMAENIEKMRAFSPSSAEQMEASYAEQQSSVMGRIQPYINILFIMISFLGVLQMFNLKKMGFFVYTAAEIIPYVFIIIGGKQAMNMIGSMGGEGGGAAQTIAIGGMVLMVLFDIAFIVMYALNLKHMKK